MSILGEWTINGSAWDGNLAAEQADDLIRIEERSPPVNPRRARYTCIQGGMVEFSGDLDLNAAGNEVSGTFTDGGYRYTIKAALTVVGANETISGKTAIKSSSDSSTGQWDGKRKVP